jgi:hypothetical protein
MVSHTCKIHITVRYIFCLVITVLGGTRWRSGWGTALQTGWSLDRFTVVSLKSFIHIVLRPHYGLGVDSASNTNEYQKYFLRVKAARCLGMTKLPHSCADVFKSGSLNLLEPSETVKACNGFTLPCTFSSVQQNHQQWRHAIITNKCMIKC